MAEKKERKRAKKKLETGNRKKKNGLCACSKWIVQFQILKNSLVQIYSKLNAKPYDYLHKLLSCWQMSYIVCLSEEGYHPWFRKLKLWHHVTNILIPPKASKVDRLIFLVRLQKKLLSFPSCFHILLGTSTKVFTVVTVTNTGRWKCLV